MLVPFTCPKGANLQEKIKNQFPKAKITYVNLDRPYELEVIDYFQTKETFFVVMDKRRRYVGNFELLYFSGGGAVGEIYKAKDTDSGGVFALKLLHEDRADRVAIDRLSREKSLLQGLSHPYILKVYPSFTWANQTWLIMEYVSGVTLEEAIGKINEKLAIVVTKKIAEAMGYVHSQGVLHRDLKPSNIMLDENNNPKILDWGIAKTLDIKEQRNNPRLPKNITLTCQIVGTPCYMPPEEGYRALSALEGAAVGPSQYCYASDVFSLGVIMAEMLMGKYPFKRSLDIKEILFSVCYGAIPQLSGNSEKIKNINLLFAKMLDKAPTNRFSMTEVVDACEMILQSLRERTQSIPQMFREKVVEKVVDKVVEEESYYQAKPQPLLKQKKRPHFSMVFRVVVWTWVVLFLSALILLLLRDVLPQSLRNIINQGVMEVKKIFAAK